MTIKSELENNSESCDLNDSQIKYLAAFFANESYNNNMSK